jgi:hypothetical protein
VNPCPWCGAKAVDVTTSADQRGADRRPRYICTGAECHEWREGDGPEPEQEPLIVLASG